MRNGYVRLWAAAVAVALWNSPAKSQNQQNQTLQTLNGEVRGWPEGMAPSGYLAALEDMASHAAAGKAEIASDGEFRLHDVPYGEYVLKIENYYGNVIAQSLVLVDAGNAAPVIYLPKEDAARPPSGGVSAARLQHPPAKKALDAFIEAQKASRSGDYAKAARELERAIAISPEFADAYSNLGAQYIRLGRYEDGVSAISRAMEVGQASALDLGNLACAQLALHRLDDAERSASAALRMDPANPSAHYVLGTVLANNPKTLREGIAHLEKAAPTITVARLNLRRAKAALARVTGD
jgi:tetratricopeptide (TPR) repeat protein